MTRSIGVAVLLLALANPATAQVNPAFADVGDEIEMVRSVVRMERKAAVEQAMQLAPAESQGFWAVYNDYEAERTKVNDRAVKVITDYAADESERAGLSIRFISLLPRLTPATELGSEAVAGYARRDGLDVGEFLDRFGPTLTPEDVGKATVGLVRADEQPPGAYLLSAAGLKPLG